MIRWLVCTKTIRFTYGLGLHPSGEVRRSLMKSIQGQYTARQQPWGPYPRIWPYRMAPSHPGGVRKPHLSARRITHQDHGANPMKSFEIWPCGAWCHNSQKHLHNMADSVIFRWWYHTSHQNMAAAFVSHGRRKLNSEAMDLKFYRLKDLSFPLKTLRTKWNSDIWERSYRSSKLEDWSRFVR